MEGRRKYTVSERVRAASRANLARANAAPKSLRYRATERRRAASLANLAKAHAARRSAGVRSASIEQSLAAAGECAEAWTAHRERFERLLGAATELDRDFARALAELTWRRLRAWRCHERREARRFYRRLDQATRLRKEASAGRLDAATAVELSRDLAAAFSDPRRLYSDLRRLYGRLSDVIEAHLTLRYGSAHLDSRTPIERLKRLVGRPHHLLGNPWARLEEGKEEGGDDVGAQGATDPEAAEKIRAGWEWAVAAPRSAAVAPLAMYSGFAGSPASGNDLMATPVPRPRSPELLMAGAWEAYRSPAAIPSKREWAAPAGGRFPAPAVKLQAAERGPYEHPSPVRLAANYDEHVRRVEAAFGAQSGSPAGASAALFAEISWTRLHLLSDFAEDERQRLEEAFRATGGKIEPEQTGATIDTESTNELMGDAARSGARDVCEAATSGPRRAYRRARDMAERLLQAMPPPAEIWSTLLEATQLVWEALRAWLGAAYGKTWSEALDST